MANVIRSKTLDIAVQNRWDFYGISNPEVLSWNVKKIIIPLFVLASVVWWFTHPSIYVPSHDIKFNYLVKYSGEASRSDRLPLLVALHGNGDTPGNFYSTALDLLDVPARIVLLEGPYSRSFGSAWPWNAADFAQYGPVIHEAIGLLANKYPTKQKPVLLGFSGGAMMAYYQAVKYGSDFAYIFAVSGKLGTDMLGDEPFQPGAPVFSFHGDNDKVLSVSGGREAVRILKEKGVEVTSFEFEGGHLGIFTSMKAEISMALEQKLKSLR